MMFKSNLIGGIIGIGITCIFLGVFIFWVKAIPIVTIMLIVVGMMVYDFVMTMREIKNSAER